MIKKLRCSLLSNEKPQDENVMWIDTSNPESFTLKLFRNGDWKPLHVVGTTRDMIERELTGYVTSHYHSYDKQNQHKNYNATNENQLQILPSSSLFQSVSEYSTYLLCIF